MAHFESKSSHTPFIKVEAMLIIIKTNGIMKQKMTMSVPSNESTVSPVYSVNFRIQIRFVMTVRDSTEDDVVTFS